MMGKDYTLAILIVNYDDNLWMDQNLQSDPELPSGWRTITDSTGTYYWHLPTGATQWEHPRESAARGRGQGLQEETSPSDKPEELHRSSWHEDLPHHDPDTKVFSVRSLGWMQVLEEDLGPGRSSIAVSHVIQQLSHQNQTDPAEPLEACGEGRDMKLVLKKDSLILLDPLDHTPLHCQPISSIRVWGVGCNNGRDRDFAFVAGDKDSCVLKCHVFRCDVPAKSIATALHQLCSKMMSEESCRPSRSLTLESISPQDFPRQVECVEAVQQQVQKFPVKYVGNLPVSTAMGMEVVNRAIESLMTSDPDDWDHAHIHVSHSALALWRGEELLWDLPVRFLTFLGVGQDSHTFAVIVDKFRRFQCHVFYCDPHAGDVSEAVQAACMVQYQRCLVAQTPRLRPKVKRAASVDATATTLYHLRGNGSGSALSSSLSNMSGAGVSVSGVRRVMAFFDTLRNKPTATSS
ncbi:amyloid-beta A4 precursor protein-binding family B member 3 [Boleophthalmus pectinirostris]|uniref:amyloid-beta A4 precursor protein-binding family B member 3 n=1 Tax=Boleophthalmus pectinirostris TaxID=150288 RepID=UPI00242AD7A3|nr:amyloid-beta A4 precursor protein-binding family B member 3 [Boleophthalmus pectinirostris]